MSEFNPNITQRVVAKVKEETSIWKTALAYAHKSLPVYYFYLVGLSVTLQSTIPDLGDYIPEKLRHWVIGIATLIVFVDKVRRSKPSEEG